MEKVRYIINIVMIGLLLLTVAVSRNGKILNTPVAELLTPSKSDIVPTMEELRDGTFVFNSTEIAKDISGYGGNTPVKIYIKDNIITKVEALDNSESPEFMGTAVSLGLLDSWNGLSVDKALNHEVDVISGATFTSIALIKSVNKTLAYITKTEVKSAPTPFTAKNIAGVLIILSGIVVSFVSKSKVARAVQLALNVIILGFWCGSFLSLALLTNWLSNGLNVAIAIVPLALLISALIMPFVGKKGHYCAWHCPLGSLQELAGKCSKKKIPISQRVVKYLNYFREGLLMALLFFMWLGVGLSLINYELFSAFLVSSANIIVLVAAIIFIILSIFINRPYCRFVCPTGTLLKFTTNLD